MDVIRAHVCSRIRLLALIRSSVPLVVSTGSGGRTFRQVGSLHAIVGDMRDVHPVCKLLRSASSAVCTLAARAAEAKAACLLRPAQTHCSSGCAAPTRCPADRRERAAERLLSAETPRGAA